jgi:hypothetical protein
MAADPMEVAALDARYNAAMASASANGTAAILGDLERETAMRSRVVISRDSTEVFRLSVGENQLYTTFYKQIEAGFRVPSDSKWDSIRQVVDVLMFPYYHNEVRFGALTLDEIGLPHYGDCHMILKTQLIERRTTTFTENSAAFVHNNLLVIPPGNRATWAQRGRLAVAKLAAVLKASMTIGDLPGILKVSGGIADDDSFVEAHVYGSISIRTVEQVSMSRTAKPHVRLAALRTNLKKLPVPFVRV